MNNEMMATTIVGMGDPTNVCLSLDTLEMIMIVIFLQLKYEVEFVEMEYLILEKIETMRINSIMMGVVQRELLNPAIFALGEVHLHPIHALKIHPCLPPL
jgi:hypothetical protein